MIFKIEVYAYFKAENIVDKGNIAQFKQYFLWQQCFQKSSATMTTKSVAGWWKVNKHLLTLISIGKFNTFINQGKLLNCDGN